MTHCSRPRFFRGLHSVIGLIVCSAGFWPAAASASASVTFHVVNDRGTPQYAYAALNGQPWFAAASTAGGDVTLSVSAGDQVRFSRNGHLGPAASSVAPPEGAAGQLYAVSASTPAAVTITLPDVHESYHQELSDAERWILGKLNADRAALNPPAPPLKISTTLTNAADVMARDEAVFHRFPDPQFFVDNQDWGWPGDPAATGFMAADGVGINPAKILAHWDGTANDGESADIWHALSDPSLRAVGIGDGGGAWIVEAMYGCPDALHAAACGIGTDTGDPHAYTPDLTAPSIAIAAPMNGTHVAQGATVRAGYSCTDGGGAGVASCDGPVPDAAAIDTSSPGVKTFTVNATDAVGNASSQSVSYSVDAPTRTGGAGATGAAGGTGGAGGSTGHAVLHLTTPNVKVRRGVAQLSLGCGRGHGDCVATLTLTSTSKHPTVLGRATARLLAGQHVTLSVRLTKRARGLLLRARRHHLHATLAVGAAKQAILLAGG